ncbi:MAG: PEGA domain-containing protein [Tidjanibacter sp.]|nr:PEGA domain-containing protein [Tidjanibacter sp.]
MILRRVIMIAMALVVGVSAVAQEHTMSISESPVEDATDLDARAYFPRRDVNDEVCALLKVTPTNPMKNKLILEVGGLGVVDRVEQENGEIWFYLPARVKNLRFSCAGYTTPPAIPVNFKSGYVYRLTIYTDAIVQSVQNAVLSATFLKIIVNVEGAVVSLGRTAEYEMVSKNLDGKIFTQRLNFGTYHYKVEHPLYETTSGTIEVKAGLADQHINLKPAYGYLNITSSPSGASLYVDGKKVGTTPWSGEERFGRGRVEVKIQTDNYYPLRQEIAIAGKGEAEKFHFDLRPQFGTVECVCDDAEAELWIDEEYKGKGRWTGPIGSLSQHILEARRAGHQSQSVVIAVKEGESATYRVGPPVALYGMLELQTTPELCEIKVDGKAMGTTPTILSLLVGKHKVELSADGYQTDAFEVEIAHNQTSALAKTLKVKSVSTPTSALAPAPTAAKTYKVGDLYDDGVKKGVVFEVSADGKSGKIVSLEESQQYWATYDVHKNATGATSETDGAMNMQKIQSIGGWQEKYPALAWCASLGEGWYLPAKNELQAISKARTKINATLEKQGLEITNNWWYWSSTKYSVYELYAWGVGMDNGDTSNLNKNYGNCVRAVSAF